jgi:hypothetical protein
VLAAFNHMGECDVHKKVRQTMPIFSLARWACSHHPGCSWPVSVSAVLGRAEFSSEAIVGVLSWQERAFSDGFYSPCIVIRILRRDTGLDLEK